MALPEREYFYLQEVVRKLDMSEFDLQYYLSHGEIMSAYWLNKDDFLKEEYDALKESYVNGASVTYEGYVSLFPNDCREVLNTGFIYGRSFLLGDYATRLSLPADRPALLIRKSSLMVDRWDLEFFMERHFSEPAEKKKGGRPSIMPQIIEEHIRRVARAEAGKSRQHESCILRMWAEMNFKDDPVPTRDTIRNALIEHDKKKKITA